MKKYLKFFRTVCIHKWYVLMFGLKLHVPIWRLLIHDFRKLHPKNFIAYAQRFFGETFDPDKFAYIWLDHQNTCPHHWEYWISRSGHIKSTDPDRGLPTVALPMPKWAVREMVADWFAASKVYAGVEITDLTNWEWYQKNYPEIKKNLHTDTINLLSNVLVDYLLERFTKNVNNTT